MKWGRYANRASDSVAGVLAFARGASGGFSTRRARAPSRVQNLFEVGKILDGLMRGREFEQPIDRLKDFRRAARQRLGDFERDVRSMSGFADRLSEQLQVLSRRC